MARIWYNGAGKILRLVKTDAEEAFHGAPAGAAGSVAFDETTNTAALADFDSNCAAHTCPAGVLKKNGVDVTIQPDGPKKTDATDFASNYDATMTDLDAIISQAQAGFANNNQRDQAILKLARFLKRTYRRVSRLTEK